MDSRRIERKISSYYFVESCCFTFVVPFLYQENMIYILIQHPLAVRGEKVPQFEKCL